MSTCQQQLVRTFGIQLIAVTGATATNGHQLSTSHRGTTCPTFGTVRQLDAAKKELVANLLPERLFAIN